MMKTILLSGWHFMRFLRLAMGIIFMIQAVQMQDKLIGVIALIFLYQAIFNKGCCGVNACAKRTNTVSTEQIEDISFKEIK